MNNNYILKGVAAQRKAYQIASNLDRRKSAGYLRKDGRLLLPLLEPICTTENGIDEVTDIVKRGASEAILILSAQRATGQKQPGRA